MTTSCEDVVENGIEGWDETSLKSYDGVIDAPEVGMEFDTYDALFEYYKSYAKQKGFAVCKRSSTKGKDGKMRHANVECYKAGKPRQRSNSLKPRPQTKVGCPAHVRGCLTTNDKWRVSSVSLDHNHELSPSKVRYMKQFRTIDEKTKRQLELHDLAENKLNKTFDVFSIKASGPENLSYNQKDCHNELKKTRRLRLMEGDAEAMNRYFMRMKADNEEFFYAMDLDEKGRLRNVFWADARSRAAFKEFGDIVTFDTTYLVKKYDMPFAPFVSVNHHGKSVLLGCGLVSNEDTDSFIWLFEAWLACMHDCAPKAIITDQCMAMKKAIECVFPASQHRWCIWHIMKKLPENLSGYTEYERICHCMKQAVYSSLTVEEFKDAWLAFITKYELQSNTWLGGLFVERACWVPAFLRGMFWAGMSSTQPRENINGYFDGYINEKTTLKQFVEQYENALTKKVEIEKQLDCDSWKSFIPCLTQYPLETQFQSVYTNDKVHEFQNELRRTFNCHMEKISESEYVIREWIFIGEEDDKHAKRVFYKVLFNEQTNETQCNCWLFELRGIVCPHQFMVWTDKGIEKVPDKYVFKRWCKNVKRVHTKVRISYDKSSNGIEARRHDSMYSAFEKVVDSAKECKDKYEKVMIKIYELTQEIDEVSVDDNSYPLEDVLVPSKESTTILDQQLVCRKGRTVKTPVKRKISLSERLSAARLSAKQKQAAAIITKKMKKVDIQHSASDKQLSQLLSTPSQLPPCTTSSQSYLPSILPHMSLPLSQPWNLLYGSALDQKLSIREDLKLV